MYNAMDYREMFFVFAKQANVDWSYSWAVTRAEAPATKQCNVLSSLLLPQTSGQNSAIFFVEHWSQSRNSIPPRPPFQ